MLDAGGEQRIVTVTPVSTPEEALQRISSPAKSSSAKSSAQPRVARSVRNNKHGTSARPWNDEFAWSPPPRRNVEPAAARQAEDATAQLERQLEEIGDDDTDFSDPWQNQRDATGKRRGTASRHRTNRKTHTVEVDPPRDDNWSDEEEADDIYLSHAYDNRIRTESHQPKHAERPLVPPLPPCGGGGDAASTPVEAAPSNQISTAPAAQKGGGKEFSMSLDDYEIDDDDDIVEVDEPMFDQFYKQDLLPVEKAIQSPVDEQVTCSVAQEWRPVGCSFVESIFTYQEGNEAVLVTSPERQPPPDTSSSGSSSGVMYPQLNPAVEVEQAEHARVDRVTPEKAVGVSSLCLPLQFESPEKQKKSPLHLAPVSLIDNDYDNEDDDDDVVVDERYASPTKQQLPVSAVPLGSPSSVSLLSSPGKSQTKDPIISSAQMLQYYEILRDPAYIHAHNAGFLWQSIVGQHIRFPNCWWNGARGPPIGEEDLPWMYFGRHSVKRNLVLNQLVKCRASAGRLLLHIVVQDLMTGTPVQDIAIGCYHPNAKGIRQGDRALKGLEDCRDVWMSVRKRSTQAVAATDALLYSQSSWDGSHSMSRSPLGPGQRVTNHNVRSVFGDKAPLETIFLSEDELYERLATHLMHPNAGAALSPPMAILQEFVFA